MAWELYLTFPSLASPQGPPMILSAAKDFSQLSKLKVSRPGGKRGAEDACACYCLSERGKSQAGQRPLGTSIRNGRQWPSLALFSNNCNSGIAPEPGG